MICSFFVSIVTVASLSKMGDDVSSCCHTHVIQMGPTIGYISIGAMDMKIMDDGGWRRKDKVVQ